MRFDGSAWPAKEYTLAGIFVTHLPNGAIGLEMGRGAPAWGIAFSGGSLCVISEGDGLRCGGYSTVGARGGGCSVWFNSGWGMCHMSLIFRIRDNNKLRKASVRCWTSLMRGGWDVLSTRIPNGHPSCFFDLTDNITDNRLQPTAEPKAAKTSKWPKAHSRQAVDFFMSVHMSHTPHTRHSSAAAAAANQQIQHSQQNENRDFEICERLDSTIQQNSASR